MNQPKKLEEKEKFFHLYNMVCVCVRELKQTDLCLCVLVCFISLGLLDCFLMTSPLAAVS